MSTKDSKTKENLVARISQEDADLMSVQWSPRFDPDIRPAGDGPLMQEFYAEVAKAMRDQQEKAQQAQLELAFADRVNRAQRGPQWRVWAHAFLLGMAGGALGAVIVWIANHGV